MHSVINLFVREKDKKFINKHDFNPGYYFICIILILGFLCKKQFYIKNGLNVYLNEVSKSVSSTWSILARGII